MTKAKELVKSVSDIVIPWDAAILHRELYGLICGEGGAAAAERDKLCKALRLEQAALSGAVTCNWWGEKLGEPSPPPHPFPFNRPRQP